MKIPVISSNRIGNLTKGRVLVIGDIILDTYWNGNVDRISPEGPFPILEVWNIEKRLGGAANVANNITSVGGKSYLLGSIGNDDSGQSLIRLLNESKIQHDLCSSDHSTSTLKIRAVAQNRQLIRLDFDNQHCSYVSPSRLKQYLPNVDIVIISDYGKGALKETEELIRLSNLSGKRVLVDPKGTFTKYHDAYAICPNKKELAFAIGAWHSEIELEYKVFSLIEDLNLHAILLTRSEEGMTLFTKEKEAISIPSIAREVYDVSGAGDTVISLLALGLSSGFSLVEAVVLANYGAGIIVGKFGTSSLTLAELENSLKEQK